MRNRRLWFFRIIATTVIPALLLVIVEGGLRIFHLAYPTGFTVKCEVNGRIAYCNHDKFSWLFFPPKIARLNIPFVIPADKPSGTYRIVVLGGSAAQGDPEHTFGVARILKAMLQNQFPQVDFEVINAAATAINSHVVLQIAKDVARHKPDLFILYLGNNEVVGPFGPGTVFSPLSSSLGLIRTSIFLKSTAIGQKLGKLLEWVAKKKVPITEWRGMEMFLEKQVRAVNPGMEKVYQHYQRNLEDILELSRRAGIRFIICTVGSNLKDSAPFASLHRPDFSEGEKGAWENIYQSGIELETKGHYAQAIQAYLKAAGTDDQFADLHYRLGKCYWALGKYEDAKKRFVQARDLDTLRFRADTRINTIIRYVGSNRAREGGHLVDAVRYFEKNSPEATPGQELFHDHVHLNFTGNYILADALCQEVGRILPDWVHQGRDSRQSLTEEECAKRLAFTGYDRNRVKADVLSRLGKAPFTNQIYYERKLERIKQELETLQVYTHPNALMAAASIYQAAIEAQPSDPWLHHNYADLLQTSGELEGASEQLRFFLRYLPQYLPPYEKLAGLLIRQGKFEEAIRQCEKALRMDSDFAPVYYHMAFALAKQGKLDESIATYEDVISLDPGRAVDTYNQIGTILVRMERLAEAVTAFRRAIRLNAELENQKDIPDVLFNLGYVLKRLNRSDESAEALEEAVQGYRKELRGNPESSGTHTLLGRALAEKGDYPQAVEHFRRALDLNPTDPTHHISLIRALEAQGRLNEAIEASRKAIQFASNHGQKEAATAFQGYLETLESRKPQGHDREIRK